MLLFILIDKLHFRLECHRGFPSGISLQDPVFQGNKCEYLKLCWEVTNPTLKVPISLWTSEDTSEDEFRKQHEHAIQNFLATTSHLALDSYYIKGPYGQNRSTYAGKRAHTIDDIFKELHRIAQHPKYSRYAPPSQLYFLASPAL